ncbi:hypothetical protein C0Q70_07931 [Pomacea canaliculata]|uniref:Uncharacterized protein n=1 Tax=Pomacea canaliculata TaxID=400727 RepID=A0A2T7PGE0_POMCA|nr:hypothetical protein C0Q70_07931 [Pomacea canaliculata]
MLVLNHSDKPDGGWTPRPQPQLPLDRSPPRLLEISPASPPLKLTDVSRAADAQGASTALSSLLVAPNAQVTLNSAAGPTPSITSSLPVFEPRSNLEDQLVTLTASRCGWLSTGPLPSVVTDGAVIEPLVTTVPSSLSSSPTTATVLASPTASQNPEQRSRDPPTPPGTNSSPTAPTKNSLVIVNT